MSRWFSKKSGDSKSGAEGLNKPKCICSPTEHPGSFKCHLHRSTTTSGGAQGGGDDHRESSSKSSGNRSGGGCSFQQITNYKKKAYDWLSSSRVGKSASSQTETEIELPTVGQSTDVNDPSQVPDEGK
ncbi:hypothetical protein U1Q18_020553 [Sarracenia purpurea var. burkii]